MENESKSWLEKEMKFRFKKVIYKKVLKKDINSINKFCKSWNYISDFNISVVRGGYEILLKINADFTKIGTDNFVKYSIVRTDMISLFTSILNIEFSKYWYIHELPYGENIQKKHIECIEMAQKMVDYKFSCIVNFEISNWDSITKDAESKIVKSTYPDNCEFLSCSNKITHYENQEEINQKKKDDYYEGDWAIRHVECMEMMEKMMRYGFSCIVNFEIETQDGLIKPEMENVKLVSKYPFFCKIAGCC